MAKVDIISGFLGAGKTTFIRKLIQEVFTDEKLVLIENEFGEVGIDGGFLKDAGIEIKELNSGCICCSLVGDFGEALKMVVETYAPDRIIIEPSGVGKLSDVMRAVDNAAQEENLETGCLVTVVDVNECEYFMKNFGAFYEDQVANARTIVLSRTQDADEESLEKVLHIIREHNRKAVVVTTPWDKISKKQVLEALEHPFSLEEEMLSYGEICPECGYVHGHDEHHHDHECDEHHDHHHDCDGHHDHGCYDLDHTPRQSCCGHDHDHDHLHADDVFTSWGGETAYVFGEKELSDILEMMAKTDSFGTVLRAKGILELQDGQWVHFDLVPGECGMRYGAADYARRFCVIGTDLKTEELQKVFHRV